MKHNIFIIFLTFLVLNSCAKEEKNETSSDKNSIINEDTVYIIGKSYLQGIIELNDSNYHWAKMHFEDVREYDSCYKYAQMKIKECELFLNKIDSNTTLLVAEIEKLYLYREQHNIKIYSNVVFEKLLEKGIISEDYIVEYVHEGDYLRDVYMEDCEDYKDSEPNENYYDEYP